MVDSAVATRTSTVPMGAPTSITGAAGTVFAAFIAARAGNAVVESMKCVQLLQ